MITCVDVIVELSVVIGCNAGLIMSGFSAKSFYKCKCSARLSACSRNATKSDTVSGIHSRQRKARVDEDFLYYMHMPKRKKSTVDVSEVDKAVHQTVDVPESTDVLLSDNNAVLEDGRGRHAPRITRRPASADRTARAANVRRDLEATVGL